MDSLRSDFARALAARRRHARFRLPAEESEDEKAKRLAQERMEAIRNPVSVRQDVAEAVREASDDDAHFYGAWRRGGSVSGAAMAKAKARQRARDRERDAEKGPLDKAIEAMAEMGVKTEGWERLHPDTLDGIVEGFRAAKDLDPDGFGCLTKVVVRDLGDDANATFEHASAYAVANWKQGSIILNEYHLGQEGYHATSTRGLNSMKQASANGWALGGETEPQRMLSHLVAHEVGHIADGWYTLPFASTSGLARERVQPWLALRDFHAVSRYGQTKATENVADMYAYAAMHPDAWAQQVPAWAGPVYYRPSGAVAVRESLTGLRGVDMSIGVDASPPVTKWRAAHGSTAETRAAATQVADIRRAIASLDARHARGEVSDADYQRAMEAVRPRLAAAMDTASSGPIWEAPALNPHDEAVEGGTNCLVGVPFWDVREASDDDAHFYGAWRRGGSVSGLAMAKAKARKRTLAARRAKPDEPAPLHTPEVAKGDTIDDVMRSLGWEPDPDIRSKRRDETKESIEHVRGEDGRPVERVIKPLLGSGKRVDEVEVGAGGMTYVAEKRPPKYLYRAVSEEDWQASRQRGYMRSDGRMNLSSDEGTVAAFEPSTFYLPGRLASSPVGDHLGRILRIRYDPADGWHMDGRDGYVKTPQFSISNVDMVSPIIVTRVYEEQRSYGPVKEFETILTREAADDDAHFYGAWRRGGSVSGGAMAKAAARQRREERERERAKVKAQKAVPAAQRALALARKEQVSAYRLENPWDPSREEFDDTVFKVLSENGLPYDHRGEPGSLLEGQSKAFGWRNFIYFGPGGEPVAAVALRNGAFKHVGGVVVAPDQRGKGYGTAMYDALQDGPVNMYQIVGRGDSFTEAGKAFTERWLEHRIAIEKTRAGITEAASDDHFYGAWRHGGHVSGAAMAKAKARARQRQNPPGTMPTTLENIQTNIARLEKQAAEAEARGDANRAWYIRNRHIPSWKRRPEYQEHLAAQRAAQPVLREQPWQDPPPREGVSSRGKAGGYSSDEAYGTNTALGRVGEKSFLGIVGGAILHPPGKGEQSPLDVRVGGANGYGFEVKAVSTRATKYAATPKPYEIAQKEAYARSLGIKPALSIVVVDSTTGTAFVYYREGLKGGRLSQATGWRFLGAGPVAQIAEALREADDDAHFYGAWRRGGTVSGAAMAKAKARQRSRERERAAAAKPEFVKPADWDSLTTEQKVAVWDKWVTEQSEPVAPSAPALLGKQYGDEPPVMPVKVMGDSVLEGTALADYKDRDGHIELSKGLITPGSVRNKGNPAEAAYHDANRVSVFAHEVGHGFESQFDLTPSGNGDVASLGRLDQKAGQFIRVDGRPFRNPSEAAAEAFSNYVHNSGPWAADPKVASWVEARLADKPNWRATVESLRAHPQPEYWAERGTFTSGLREASDDDHFYGAWRRGGSVSGLAMAKAKARRRTAMERRVGNAQPEPGADAMAYLASLRATTDAADEAKARQAVDDACVKVRDFTDHEEGFVISKRGDILEHATEDPAITAQVAAVEKGVNGSVQFRSIPPDSHVVHNHPTGWGLSDGDIKAAVLNNAASVTAIGTNELGERWRYALYRPQAGWPKGFTGVYDAAEDTMVAVRSIQANAESFKAYREGRDPQAAMDAVMKDMTLYGQHETLTRVAARYPGMRYERTSW